MSFLASAYEAMFTTLKGGTWNTGMTGFALPGDIYGGAVPEGVPKPYLRLDYDGRNEAPGLRDKTGSPLVFYQIGTAWAAEKHLARRIADGAAERIESAYSLAGYRVLDIETRVETLPPNPQDPGSFGALFDSRITLTPTA